MSTFGILESLPSYWQASDWHDALRSHWTFDQVVESHAVGGVILATPSVFVMARRIVHSWSDEQICHPQITASPEEADCWHVWLLAGDFREAVERLDRSFPFVSWHRRGKLKVHRLDHVLQRFAR